MGLAAWKNNAGIVYLVIKPICVSICDVWICKENVVQMTKIYPSYTFGLHPQFLTHSSQNPWHFLSVESDRSVSLMLMR